MDIARKITNLLEEKFKEPDFSDCFLIEINLKPKNKLEIFLDSDQGITFQKCKRISRHLESYLDEEQWLGEKYTLEVSSPGISRPLKLRRQYLKNVGRKIKVSLNEEESPLEGKLIQVEEEEIIVEREEIIKEGKKKKKVTVQDTIPFTKIKSAVIQVSFN